MADDLMGFRGASRLLIKNKYPWETAKLGINIPPIKTPHGWLTIYHALGHDKFYRLGALLLDLDDPGKVLHRTPDWLMQPEEDYEIEGFYRGVCFPCGAVVIDGTLLRLLRRRRQVLRGRHLRLRRAGRPPAGLPGLATDPCTPSTSPSSPSTCS